MNALPNYHRVVRRVRVRGIRQDIQRELIGDRTPSPSVAFHGDRYPDRKRKRAEILTRIRAGERSIPGLRIFEDITTRVRA